MKILISVILMLLSYVAIAWQDDAQLFLRDAQDFFVEKNTLTPLSNAQSEIRLGRYIEGDNRHSWRGGVEGDVALLQYGNLLWHWNLNIETLADDLNEIHFRLVQVYYQTLTGLSWRFGPGIWSLSYSHRCSHGADNAERSRIIIRSGLRNDYDLSFMLKKMRVLFRSSLDAYITGQNSDRENQSRGQLSFSSEISWPVKDLFSILVSASFGEELVASGASDVFFLLDNAKAKRLRPFGGARLGVRFENSKVKNDYSLSFSHIADTGFKAHAQSHNGLSFDVNFYW